METNKSTYKLSWFSSRENIFENGEKYLSLNVDYRQTPSHELFFACLDIRCQPLQQSYSNTFEVLFSAGEQEGLRIAFFLLQIGFRCNIRIKAISQLLPFNERQLFCFYYHRTPSFWWSLWNKTEIEYNSSWSKGNVNIADALWGLPAFSTINQARQRVEATIEDQQYEIVAETYDTVCTRPRLPFARVRKRTDLKLVSGEPFTRTNSDQPFYSFSSPGDINAAMKRLESFINS